MSNRRHHIHLICDSRDETLRSSKDTLAIFFEERAFLTTDLCMTTSDSANYSWRCIHACDYVLMLLGQSYGELTNTGVSQLHISYINAKTKHKPMAIFIQKNTNKSRQLADLEAQIRAEGFWVYDFESHVGLKWLIVDAYQMLTKQYAKAGWIIANDDFDTQETVNDYNQLQLGHSHRQLLDLKLDTQKLASFDKRLNDKALDNQDSDYKNNYKAKTAYEHTLIGAITSTPTLSLQDDLMLSCTAHAFQGGTLIEVAFLSSMTWHSILSKLMAFDWFSTQTLWKALNELSTPQAMPAIKLTHPNVHAISRCQVTKGDMLWVQESLIKAGWISKFVAPAVGAMHKEGWQMTSLVRNTLNSPPAKSN